MGSLKEEFFKRVIIKDGCWEWTNRLLKSGYGNMKFNGKTLLAHRVSLIVHGFEIPERMCVDHICKNRGCINPNHLRIVTTRQNVLENSNGITAKNKLKTNCLRGHELSYKNLGLTIDKNGANKRYCKQCKYDYKKQWKANRKALGYPWWER